MPGKSKRERDEVLERRHRVFQAWICGKRQMDLATAEGVSRRTIRDDIEWCRQQYVQMISQDAQEHTALQLAKLDAIEEKAWAAWERSCDDAEVRRVSRESGRTDKGGNRLPDVEKQWVEKRGQAGDPRFLEAVQRCSEQRCKLLGLVKPAGATASAQVIIINGKPGQEIFGADTTFHRTVNTQPGDSES